MSPSPGRFAPEAETDARRGRRRPALVLALGLSTVIAGAALGEWWRWGDALRHHLGSGYLVVLALLGLSVAAPALAAVRELRSGHRPRRAGGAAALARAWFWHYVLAAGGYVLTIPSYRVVYAWAFLGIAEGVFGTLALLEGRGRQPLVRPVDFLLTCLAVTLVLLELTLRLWGTVAPHPLLASHATDEAEFIASWRLRAGDARFGYAVNSRGDYDAEPRPDGDERELVVSIGDSFASGTVSLPLHFTSVAEREAPGLSVYNMGGPAIGPAEYAYLLVHEALPLAPTCVVVHLFVGNDLTAATPERRPRSGPAFLFDGEQLTLVRFARRWAKLAAEERRAREEGAGGGALQGEEDADLVSSVEEALTRYPWFADPSLERPTFTADRFLSLEIERAVDVCAEGIESYPTLSRLEEFVASAGDVPVVLALIPDEFQVEDELWEAVRAGAGVPLERDRPQRILHAWAAARGIPVLDYLPVLREVEPLANGKRHLYLLRDSHWNARGNEAAGRALGRFLRDFPREPGD